MGQNKIFLLFISFLLIMGFQNCGPGLKSAGQPDNSLSAQSFDGVFQKVISARCIECHSGPAASGGIDLSSYDAIIASGSVVPGNSEASSLFTEISSGQMPPTQPLSPQDVAAIADWIDAGAQDEGGSAANEVPLVDAGEDSSQMLPQPSLSFMGTATDSDGTIKEIFWRQLSGPNMASLLNARTPTLTVSNLVVGTYTFQLEATDNLGALARDTVVLTITQASNANPMANAGTDQNLTAPTNTTTLSGSASDSDGTIASTAWSQLSGPASATIQSPNNLSTMVSGMNQIGTYEFQLLVTDDQGGTASDAVKVVINLANNALPIADAGNDQNIALPTDMLTLNGSASDSDGNVASYAWTQTTGPSAATLTGANSADLTAANLVAGQYRFELTATDNNGGQGSDQVVVTVNAAPVAPTFTELNQSIFGPKCLTCHSGPNPAGNYGMDSYAQVVSEVVAGDADASELYARVIDNSMPKGQSPLSAAEKTRIKDWIDAGAENN